MGQELPGIPTEPSKDLLKFRLELIQEEVLELYQACKAWSDGVSIIKLSDQPIDMVAMADALADIDYVVEGMRIACGISGLPIAAEVHRTNMAKLGAGKDSNGKIRKPDGWTPPDIKGELEKQGWKP